MSALAQGDLSFEEQTVENEICFPAASRGEELLQNLLLLRDTIVVVGCMVYLRAMLLLRSWNY
jgi:hypothetical protein